MIAEELSKKVGTIKNQRENRRIRIANFFNKLGICLEKIIVAVEKNQPFDNRVEELKTYVDSFSFAVGDIIGFELTERLLELMRKELDEESFKKFLALPELEQAVCKKTLKSASEKFIDLWSILQ